MHALLGAFRYEFLMQVRRPAVWLLQLVLSLGLLSGNANPWNMASDTLPRLIFGHWAHAIALFLPLAYGLILADRLVRDRRLKVDGLLASYPTSLWSRLLGKYFGAALGTMMPILAIYISGIIWSLFYMEAPAMEIILWALYAFVTIVLPGLLFVAAFSIGCPAIMPVPLYQVLFVGYWGWGNWINPDWMFTLSNTILTPSGPYMTSGLFQVPGLYVSTISKPLAIASILLLLTGATLALWATHRVWQWQQSRA